jgi:hypothetical protein
VRRPRQAQRRPGRHAGGVGGEHGPYVRVEQGELLPGRLHEADAPGEPIDGQAAHADELRQRAAGDAQQRLELEGAVLAVAEAEAVPGVGVGGGVDGGDAPAVAPDAHRPFEAGGGQGAAGDRQAPAEQNAEHQLREVHGERPLARADHRPGEVMGGAVGRQFGSAAAGTTVGAWKVWRSCCVRVFSSRPSP